MRANTDRTLALSFDAVAELYDSARPRFSTSLIAPLLKRFDVDAATAEVLEIGAGTGQLTGTLLSLGCTVVAVEPGAAMARMIDPRASVVNDTFEEARLGGRTFDLVASANAFHWVDPVVGHDKVASLLRDDGLVLLLWNFPLPLDDDVQATINAIVAEAMPDAVMDRGDVLEQVAATLEDGRAEIAARGALEVVEWGWEVETWSMTPLDRLRLSASYASSVGRSLAELEHLAQQVTQRGISSCDIENRIYWLAARRVG